MTLDIWRAVNTESHIWPLWIEMWANKRSVLVKGIHQTILNYIILRHLASALCYPAELSILSKPFFLKWWISSRWRQSKHSCLAANRYRIILLCWSHVSHCVWPIPVLICWVILEAKRFHRRWDEMGNNIGLWWWQLNAYQQQDLCKTTMSHWRSNGGAPPALETAAHCRQTLLVLMSSFSDALETVSSADRNTWSTRSSLAKMAGHVFANFQTLWNLVSGPDLLLISEQRLRRWCAVAMRMIKMISAKTIFNLICLLLIHTITILALMDGGDYARFRKQ